MHPAKEILVRSLYSQRRSGIIWAVVLVLLALMTISVWPSMKESAVLENFSNSLPSEVAGAFGMTQMGTASGYLMGNLYSLLLPLLLCAMSIAATSALTAGDEETGRLELLLALPISRRLTYLVRITSVLLITVLTGIILALVVIGGRNPFELDIPIDGIVAISTALTLLAVFHAGLAYAVAAAGGRRSTTISVTAAVLLVGYVADSLAPLVSALEPVQHVSPWQWALGSDPLTDGFDILGMALLAGLSVVLVTIGTILIGRRDIRSV